MVSVPYVFGTNVYAQSGQIDADFASLSTGTLGAVAKAGDTMTGELLVNLNASTPAAPITSVGTAIYVIGADGSNNRIVNDAYGTTVTPIFVGRHARGTGAAPSAVQSGDNLVSFSSTGYAASAFAGGPSINMTATETWTATANGSAMYFATTPATTTAAVNSLILNGNTATFSGNITIPANSTLYLNGATSGQPGRIWSDGTTVAIVGASSSGYIKFANAANTVNNLLVDDSGNLTINGATATKPGSTSWVNPSAVELKQDVRPYRTGLESILRLNPVTYRYNEDTGYSTTETHIGLLHHETRHMPEMHRSVVIDTVDGPTEVDALDCSAVTFALVNACKDLASQNETLIARIEALEKR